MYKYTRINRKRAVILIIIAVLSVFFITRCVSVSRGSVRAESPADIVIFLGTFGWAVEPEPVTVRNVQIPARFTEAYQRYNDLQKQQGFDLSRYRADIVESYTFRVLNHPVVGDVFANVLVFRGRIIGGDICSFAINGFMTTFDGKAM